MYCNHLNSISLLFSTIYKFLFSVTCILLTNAFSTACRRKANPCHQFGCLS
nr:MAG TPA: hypothetical protein [Caudoviricetes sp.]